MLKALFYLFLREKRNFFINKYALPIRLFSSLLNILFYYFATEAFEPKYINFDEMAGWTLFEYVIIGELTLFFVSDSLVIFGQQTKQIIASNSFDPLLNTKTSYFKILFMMGSSSYLLSLITITFEISVLTLFFKLNFSFFNVLKTVILNLAFLPFFMALGIMAAASLILFKKGFGLYGTLIGLLGAVSGAYFPTDALPYGLGNYLKYVNPLQTLVEESRAILKGSELLQPYPMVILVGIIMGTSALWLSSLILNLVIHNFKKKGEMLVFPTT